MKNNKNITDPYVGMKIKICLPTNWCQVDSLSPYQWLKGKIIEIPLNRETGEPYKDAIVISIWSKKVGRINRMMCFRQKNCEFNRVIQQLH